MEADGTRHNDPAPDRRLNVSYLNVQVIAALGKVPFHMNLSFLVLLLVKLRRAKKSRKYASICYKCLFQSGLCNVDLV
jgi:hypothetical protein